MVPYKLFWRRSAESELRSLPPEAIYRLVKHAEALRNDPRPPGCHKLAESERTYRVRSGDYELVYIVEDYPALVVEVVRVVHREKGWPVA